MNKNIIFRGDVDLSTVKVYMLTPNCVLEPKHCKKHDKVLDVKPTQDGFSVSFICVGVHGKKFKPLQVYITAESKRELLCSQQFTLIGARDEARIREFAYKHEQPILPLPPLPPVPQVPTQFQKNAPRANPPPSTQLDPNELTALYQGNTPNGTTESMDTQDDPASLETAAFQNSLKEERMEITQDDPVTLVTPSLDNFLNEDSKNRYADFKLSRFDN